MISKHGDIFDEEPGPNSSVSHRAVLVVARRLDQMQSGSSQYLKGYLEICQRAGLSTVLVFAPQRSFGNVAWAKVHKDFKVVVDQVDWAQCIQVRDFYISTSLTVWTRFLRRTGAELYRRLSGHKHEPYPSLLGAELDRCEARQTVSRARALNPTTVTAEYSSLAPILSEFAEARRIVFLHDLFSLRAESFGSRGKKADHVVLSLEEEASRCHAANILIHASCVELEQMRDLLPQASHIWMRPAVHVQPLAVANLPTSAPRAVFIGSRHGGNAAALSFLRKEVWPKVRDGVPGAMLDVVGSIAGTVDPDEARKEGLRLVGPVDDLSGIGGEDSIGLAPMQFGSGIPIKVVDYLSLGMTVVVTPGAIDAFGGSLDGLVAEAKTEQRYSELIIHFLTDSMARHKMAAKSKNLQGRLENTEILRMLCQ